MAVRIRVQPDDDVQALESLADWLRGEPDLAGRVRLASSEPREGELGALAEAVVVGVGSGGAISVLAASLKTWLAHPRRSDVRVVLEGPDDRKVEIDVRRAKSADIERLVRTILDGRDPE
ncbi:hypothetical protein FB559_8148 [Actinoallomurus bryophytorum]|uniref:Uncharacterized protein n=1 Tax=Actinoallomurus bryophytorum TaxID=1490222 RepID=A0A543C189_9ACTN|nr:hypothetical protein [Actinoallomurus bryophytorum]TQL90834.1 hypothetical protein FB559_8148 [Actinoallomurus bryophytorum]